MPRLTDEEYAALDEKWTREPSAQSVVIIYTIFRSIVIFKFN